MQYLGMSMTFTIFEFVKENLDKLLQDQPDVIVAESRVDESLGKLDIRGLSPTLLYLAQRATPEQINSAISYYAYVVTNLTYAIKRWVVKPC